MNPEAKSVIEEINLKEIQNFPVKLYIKREDLLHPIISGNKWRKLKYNLEEARRLNHDTLLTFGGAYSNHIAATAEAGKEFGLKTIGVIRGDEKGLKNETLNRAESCGMHLHFVSREKYREKGKPALQKELRDLIGEFYLIPEGGSNTLAVKGCEEILDDSTLQYDVITCAVGTGGTLAGLLCGKSRNQRLVGFPALKNAEFLKEVVESLAKSYTPDVDLRFELELDYHFGGYAKITEELVQFTGSFYEECGIKLDLIYTAKMVYGVIDQIKKGVFNDKKILLIHTGGLQGNEGIIKRYGLDELFRNPLF